MTDEYHSYHVEIPEAADNIIRQDCSLKEAHPLAKIEEIQRTALLLFAGYLNAATSIAASSGGGGSDTGGWGRDKDEDELEWARRCARMATACANAGKDFIDKRTINNKCHGNWKSKNHSINKR